MVLAIRISRIKPVLAEAEIQDTLIRFGREKGH